MTARKKKKKGQGRKVIAWALSPRERKKKKESGRKKGSPEKREKKKTNGRGSIENERYAA